mmetsp:Transcript_47880/g.110970  ORF Transcript_47880/g.110970 Transcript_47880/m.110970 type:complete len:215 (-) Transcript_47880:189-833(-)
MPCTKASRRYCVGGWPGRARLSSGRRAAILVGFWAALHSLAPSPKWSWVGVSSPRLQGVRGVAERSRRAEVSGKTKDPQGGGEVFVKRAGDPRLKLHWNPEDTVGDLKKAIAVETDIPPAKQALRADLKALEADDVLVANCAALSDSKLEVWLFDERTPEERRKSPTRASRQYVDLETDNIDGIKVLVYGMGIVGVLTLLFDVADINPLEMFAS